MSTRPDFFSPASPRGPRVALAWGFAEATFFFIVPDFFLTRFALRKSYRRVLAACLCALAGALVGGVLLWLAARNELAPRLLHAFMHLPGIDDELVARSGRALQQRGAHAFLAGGFVGYPYKLMAVHAGAQDWALGRFLVCSAAARFSRFWLTSSLAWVAGRVFPAIPERSLRLWHTGLWTGFYLVYFLTVP